MCKRAIYDGICKINEINNDENQVINRINVNYEVRKNKIKEILLNNLKNTALETQNSVELFVN